MQNYTLSSKVRLKVKTPYFIKNTYLGNYIYLAQNTDDLGKAIDIAQKWKTGKGYNEGYDAESAEKVAFSLFVYESSSKIEEYYVEGAGNPKNIKIIGYRYTDEEMQEIEDEDGDIVEKEISIQKTGFTTLLQLPK